MSKERSDDYCEGYLKALIHSLLANPEITALQEAGIKSSGKYCYEDGVVKRALKLHSNKMKKSKTGRKR